MKNKMAMRNDSKEFWYRCGLDKCHSAISNSAAANGSCGIVESTICDYWEVFIRNDAEKWSLYFHVFGFLTDHPCSYVKVAAKGKNGDEGLNEMMARVDKRLTRCAPKEMGGSYEFYYRCGLDKCRSAISNSALAIGSCINFAGTVNGRGLVFIRNDAEKWSLYFTIDYLPIRRCSCVKVFVKEKGGKETLDEIMARVDETLTRCAPKASKRLRPADPAVSFFTGPKKSIVPALVPMCIGFFCAFSCLVVSLVMLIDLANLWTPFIVGVSLFACFMAVGVVSLVFLRKTIRHNTCYISGDVKQNGMG